MSVRRFNLWRLRRAYRRVKAENDVTFWAIHARIASVSGKERVRATIETFKRDHRDAHRAQKALFNRIVELEGR